MHLAYFDEVKPAPPAQPYHWLCAIIVDAARVAALENEVSQLAMDCFGHSSLVRETEFHAAPLFNRAAHFRSWNDPEVRINVMKRLFTIIDRHEEVGKVYARLDPRRMSRLDDVDERAFMFFVERVEMALADRNSPGLLIGDFESDKFSGVAARNLSSYRTGGTPYQYGREIHHLIDTVHFTHSHHSRMLQLADCFAWTQQLCHSETTFVGGLRESVAKYVREKTRLNHPHAPVQTLATRVCTPTSLMGRLAMVRQRSLQR